MIINKRYKLVAWHKCKYICTIKPKTTKVLKCIKSIFTKSIFTKCIKSIYTSIFTKKNITETRQHKIFHKVIINPTAKSSHHIETIQSIYYINESSGFCMIGVLGEYIYDVHKKSQFFYSPHSPYPQK